MLIVVRGPSVRAGIRGTRVVTIASFNVENLFALPKAFTTAAWAQGENFIAVDREFHALIAAEASERDRKRELLVELGVYHRNTHGGIRGQAHPPAGLGVAAEEPGQLRSA